MERCFFSCLFLFYCVSLFYNGIFGHSRLQRKSKKVALFSVHSRFANKGQLYCALGTSQEKYDVSLCSISVDVYLNPVVCFVMSPCSYKFTLDKLYSMRASVTLRVESYKKWLCDVQEILENKTNKKRGPK